LYERSILVKLALAIIVQAITVAVPAQ